MKALKRLVRILSEVLGGIAVLVFIRAPFTNNGWMLMAGSVIVALACMAAYLWSEPDEDPSLLTKDSN
jgi:hypothetical protein